MLHALKVFLSVLSLLGTLTRHVSFFMEEHSFCSNNLAPKNVIRGAGVRLFIVENATVQTIQLLCVHCILGHNFKGGGGLFKY